MVTKNEGLTESDIIVLEEDKRYSRETVTILSGEGELSAGAVLGKITASSKYVLSDPTQQVGREGAETANAVLIEKVDATSGDAKGVVLKRHAVVNRANLSFQADVDTAGERQAKVDQLADVGIIAREGA